MMMKQVFLRKTALIFIFSLFSITTFAQKEFKDTLHVKVDGELMKTQPRKIKMGRHIYCVGYVKNPETMLRIWLADFKGKPVFDDGVYVIVNGQKTLKTKTVKKHHYLEKYQGIAAVRYVKETKKPRMRFHVGDSRTAGDTLTVTKLDDQHVKIEFDHLKLKGTYWKEKTTSTIFGGLGRLKKKVTSKIASEATGFDWNLDPEGNGYKQQKKTDAIALTDGVMILNVK